MGRIELFPSGSNAYKANFHCHTTNSDGAFTPEETKELYQRNGYSVVAFTDHWTYFDNSYLSDESFLALSGYELNYDLRQKRPHDERLLRTCHICAIAKDAGKCKPVEGTGPYDIAYINDQISQLRSNGFIVNLNHTAWSAMPLEDILAIEGAAGMELYNSTCEYVFHTCGELNNYKLAVINGKRFLPLATDDNHRGMRAADGPRATPDCCNAYIMLFAEKLCTEDILSAYQRGDYYCSNGPRIYSAVIEGDRLTIDCSPVSRAYLKSEYVTFLEPVLRDGDTLTHVEFDISSYRDDARFITVELVDSHNRFAMTVPYYFGEHEKRGC